MIFSERGLETLQEKYFEFCRFLFNFFIVGAFVGIKYWTTTNQL